MGTIDNCYIYPNVTLGVNSIVGTFVILGEPPRDRQAGELATVIGANALIRSHTVIYAGNVIGRNLQTGHGVMIRELNDIGDDVSIGTHSMVEHHVHVGHRVRIHSNVFIPEFSVLEDDVWVGPGVVLTNARYPASRDAKKSLEGPHLMAGSKIGAAVTILPGVVIGHHALVGAGAVVVRDVPDGKVVVGNPARIIRDVTELEVYE